MKLPKFIITMNGYFRLGMVDMHKDLLMHGEQCIGGGYYRFEHDNKCLILEGASYDFGQPLWHLLDSLIVPLAYKDYSIVYKYDDGYHDDYIINDELSIEYYD